jgi:hypothetical protein
MTDDPHADGAGARGLPSTRAISLDGNWLLATDPGGVGRDEGWQSGPRPDAVTAKVPWIVQGSFPGYHGLAWYWRTFHAPAAPCAGYRYLLRFWAVDYLADVWVNDLHVGGHEGGETPFVLDVSESVRPSAENLLAVRVLNPTHEAIDGIVLNETPHRNKALPYGAGSDWNHGGIVDSVELLVAPPVRVCDLFVRADPESGLVRITAALQNAGSEVESAEVAFTIAPAARGEAAASRRLLRELPPGETVVQTQLHLPDPRAWDLNDPFLYRLTAQVRVASANAADELSTRFGFRDFRFRDGYFRLNGRRLFLRCSHTGNSCPIGLHLPHDPDLLRRDLLNVKTMGFNAIRFIAGMPTRYQLDLCDDIGLLVYEESYAGWCLADSQHMRERFDRATTEMVLRDRNHPCVVIWGLLNETQDGPVFRHAVEALALVRSLDDSRMVMLNSGRWDGQMGIGSIANPGSDKWEHLLGAEQPGAASTALSSPGGYCERAGDAHAYPRVPHLPATIRFLRTVGEGSGPIFLSEYGIGSPVDLWRTVRHYERLGAQEADDARFYRDKLERFLLDWERWGLAATFGRPEDYFRAALAKMADQRLLGLNAIRANPNIGGYSLTGTVDQGMTGEGLTTTFREPKPGTIDALFDGLAPLRCCLFAEPAHIYVGGTVRLEAVLANEDALAPGEYPAQLLVIGPDRRPVFERELAVTVPQQGTGREPPFAIPVFSEDIEVSGPPGEYRFVATFLHGAAATGGDVRFYVSGPEAMPGVDEPVGLWGDDPELAGWLAANGIGVRGLADPPADRRQVIVCCGLPPAPGGAEVFADLARQVARGSVAVFLTPGLFREGDDPVRWLPLATKGELRVMASWLYLKDEWAAAHPIFDGMPAGGLMDYQYYREIIPDEVFCGQDAPAEAVAGAINAAQDYASGLLVAVYELGAGRFILNSLRIRENLGTHPAAERLLRNMLHFAARDIDQPYTKLPPNLDSLLRAMGYGPS